MHRLFFLWSTMKPLINCSSCRDASAVQVLRALLARSTWWYRIMQNGCLSFTGTRMELKRSGWTSTLYPEFGAVAANPSHPIACAFHSVLLTCDREHCPLHCEPVLCFDRLILFLLLTSLKDGCWDVLGHERDVHPQRWAGRQMMSWEQQGKGSDSKGGSWHTHWSRCTLPGTVQTKQRNRIKRFFPFRQNKVKKKAVHNSTLQFLVAETIFLSRVC